ncbi:Anticodon-binding domain of tRNA, partial [Musa troglodytarum]
PHSSSQKTAIVPALHSPRPPLTSAGDPAAPPTPPMEDVCEGKEFSFPQQEESILRFWSSIRAFETQLKRTELMPEYIFYDGPPFATGLPHYGHILAGTIKDVVTRYQSMNGHHVTRRFGWDCHGLPVEFEIDTKLGIRTRDDVLAMGIANYNEECRAIVTRYVKEWEEVITRTGRWIDFKNDYKTMDLKFMESVWWVFAQLWKKELVYRGFKVMPYSTGCKTPLSNFEAGLNYKDVSDPAIMVSFPIVGDPHNAALVAWTTTPWTLPSNLALCVNADFVYVKVREKSSGATYVVAESRLSQLPSKKSKSESGGAVVPAQDASLPNSKSKGTTNSKAKSGVDAGSYQLMEKITGASLVGLRYVPLFDYFMNCSEAAFRVVSDNYVTDDSGTGVVHCAPAFGEDDYRVCVASGIIKDVDLFVAVDADGCFTKEITDFCGRYVKDADKDIINAVKARAYYEDGREKRVIGSIDELEKLSGAKVTDLHRHNIDHITIPSEHGSEFGVLRRVDDVSQDLSGTPDGIDLDGGFHDPDRFYTLMVLSTALFEKPAFRNLICNGLVLAEDGKKMSKRLKNYPSPTEVIDDYGADALRLYLINSPVVRAEPLRFKKDGVYGVVKDVFLPWYNAYRFLVQNAKRLEVEGFAPFFPIDCETLQNSSNVLDQWINSATESLVHFVRQEMDSYRLYTREERIERSVIRMMTVIDLARNIRERHSKPLKTPLKEMIVVHPDSDFLEDITGKLREYVLEELNIKSVVPCNDPLRYASLRAEPDFSILGKRLGKAMGAVAKEVKSMSQADILLFEQTGEATFSGHCLKQNDIKVLQEFKRPADVTEKEIDAAGDGDVLVILDLRADESLFDAGVAREVVNRIQKLRKKAGLEPTDIVELYYESLEKDEKILEKIVNSQCEYIKDALGSPLLHKSWAPSEAVIFCQEEFQVQFSHEEIPNLSFIIIIAKPALVFNLEAIVALYSGNNKYAENLQTYLSSRDLFNLKSEFPAGNGKIKVDCIENQPSVDLELGKHLFLSVADFYLSRKTG